MKLKYCTFIFFILFGTACADFKDIFSATPNSSQNASKFKRGEVIEKDLAENQDSSKYEQESKEESKQEQEIEKQSPPPPKPQLVKTYIPHKKYYIVKRGDTIIGIGKKVKVAPQKLIELNHLKNPSRLKVGQKLLVKIEKQVKYVEVAPVLEPSENQIPKPENENQKLEEVKNKDEKKIAKKEKKKSKKEKQKYSSKKNQYTWPLDAPVTSEFGKRRGRSHDGVDIPAPHGTKVKASRSGKVLHAGHLRGYGNLVILRHSGNMFTAYAHLQKINVTKDQKVKQNSVVGTVGSTGHSSTPHLHFEIRHKTAPKDPLLYLPKR